MTEQIQIDHKEYPESLKKKTIVELHFIMKDAYQAMRAMPDGPKTGYYADEINYCCNEIHRRRTEK